MVSSDIMTRLTTVFRQMFDDDTMVLSETTTARDVPGWDSLMHINLIIAIEKEFEIRFTTREINTLKNIGDLVGLIARKNGTGA